MKRYNPNILASVYRLLDTIRENHAREGYVITYANGSGDFYDKDMLAVLDFLESFNIDVEWIDT